MKYMILNNLMMIFVISHIYNFNRKINYIKKKSQPIFFYLTRLNMSKKCLILYIIDINILIYVFIIYIIYIVFYNFNIVLEIFLFLDRLTNIMVFCIL